MYDPEDTEAHFNLGKLLIVEDCDMAKAHFVYAAKSEQQDQKSEAYFNIGLICQIRKEYEEAVSWYK